MLEKLYKKLHIIFVCGNMLIISIVMGIMLKSNIEAEQMNGVSYVHRMATLMIYQLENNRNSFWDMIKDYEQSDTLFCSLETASGEKLYQSDSTFPTSAESLLQALGEQEQSALSIWGDETINVTEQNGPFLVKGKKGDLYWGVPAVVVSKDNTVYHLVLLYRSKTTAELLRKYIPLYLFVWFAAFACVVFLIHFVLKQAFKPSVQALDSQKAFIASASHELKSPLAVLLAHVGKLRRLGIDHDELDRSVNIMDRECMRMSQLVEDMLLLASADAKHKTTNNKEICIDTLLISFYEKYEAICTKHGFALSLELGNTSYPILYSDPELIMQILCIFMDNAISHSSSSPSIEIQASLTAKNITFYVVDHGKGISERDKPFLFDRFYCADQSHTDKSHFGLGLSIAAELSAMLHGEIGFHDTPGGGSTFYITLPIHTSANG